MEQHTDDPKPMVHSDDPRPRAHTDDPKPHSSRVIRHQGLSMRMSVRELERPENSAKRNAFLRAWKRIQELPPNNPNSFWAIAGFHGEPYRAPYYNKPDAWGGYCQHATVLFPTWHRYYLVRLEQALQTVCPEDDIAMAYWDATSEESLKNGIPNLLTAEKVEIDGEMVNNPLASFILPQSIDQESADEYYYKPNGYETLRYPFSGICSPEKSAEVAKLHNKSIEKYFTTANTTATILLNENIKQWLDGPAPEIPPSDRSVLSHFKACLEVQSYNKFSNTDSSAQFMPNIPSVALEDPHNDLHLAIGGFTMPEKREAFQIIGANGDMGENETAGFDPIFFFHHCNIDRVFWVWQKKHGKTDSFDIDPTDQYGTIASMPTIGQKPDETLTMDTPLTPFQHANGVPVTSKDCINIHDLGYDYTIGSLDQEYWPPYVHIQTEFEKPKTIDDLDDKPYRTSRIVYDMKDAIHFKWNPTHKDEFLIKIGNINRDKYSGSKLLRLYYRTAEPSNFIGQKSILSRWNRESCGNCKNHHRAGAWFSLKNTPITYKWPPAFSNFVATFVYFNPEEGKYVEVPVPIEETHDDDQDEKPYMKFLIARGSHGKSYYDFMQS